MKHIPKMILFALGMPQLILSIGCPDPIGLGPRTDDDKSMCAILYEHADIDHYKSCYGSQLQVRNGEAADVTSEWNDRVSSLVVREGCTLTGYEDYDHTGKRKAFTGWHYYLPNELDYSKKKWDWNDKISSYICECIFAPVNCTAEDKWKQLTCCDNQSGDDITCTYHQSHGISIGQGFTQGHEISDTISKSLGIEIGGMFSASAGASLTTGYSWSESTEFSTTEEEGVDVGFHMSAGSQKCVYQILGECGDSTTKSLCFQVRDMHTKRVLDTTCP